MKIIQNILMLFNAIRLNEKCNQHLINQMQLLMMMTVDNITTIQQDTRSYLNCNVSVFMITQQDTVMNPLTPEIINS